MNARDTFKVNDRVRLSVYGTDQRIRMGDTGKGTVRGFSRNGEQVRVQADDRAAVENYAVRWVELDQ